jgi:type IV secretion system protein TrbL
MSFCSLPVAGDVCSAASSVAGDAFKSIANDFADAMATIMKDVFTYWTNVGTPALGGSQVMLRMQGYLFWLQGFVLVFCLLITAGKVCMNRSGQPAAEALKGLFTLVLVTGASVAGIDLMIKAGDGFSTWVINQAAGGGDLGARMLALTGGAAAMGPLGTGLEFSLAFVGILAAFGQLLLMISRIAVLPLLTGMLPLAASAVGTDAGKAWFQKLCAWLFAFVIYKPVAALVYATAFTLIGSGTDLTSICAGLMLLVLSILALPALMRLAVPAVGAVTSGGGGAALAGIAATGAVATGAIKLGESRSSSSAASPPAAAASAGRASGAAPAGASAAGAGGASAGGAMASAGAAAGGAGAVLGAAVQAGQHAQQAASRAAGAGSPQGANA